MIWWRDLGDLVAGIGRFGGRNWGQFDGKKAGRLSTSSSQLVENTYPLSLSEATLDDVRDE